MQIVYVKVSGERGINVYTNYIIGVLEIAYFVTDLTLEEIEARLKVSRVQAVVKADSMPGLRQPIYIIIGLMIVKGFAVLQKSRKYRAGEVKAHGNIPTPANNVELEANLVKSAGTEKSDTWKIGEEIVFVYQLFKIEVKGQKGIKIEYNKFRHKIAFLSKDDKDNKKDDKNEIAGQVITSVINKDNLLVSRNISGFTIVELGKDESKITYIAIVDI